MRRVRFPGESAADIVLDLFRMEVSVQKHQDVSDAQWRAVEMIFRNFRARKDPRGRRAHNPRTVFNGVLWVLTSGTGWATLPKEYPDYRTCHRQFKAWYAGGVLREALQRLFGADGIAMHEAVTTRMRITRSGGDHRHHFAVDVPITYTAESTNLIGWWAPRAPAEMAGRD